MAKKLYRSRNDKVIAGVCGGLGDYFDIDSTIIRIAWVAFTFAGGAGIIAYIVAWLLIPLEPSSKIKKEKTEEEHPEVFHNASLIFGTALIIIGIMLIPGWGWTALISPYFWPVLIICIGIILIIKHKQEE